MALGIVSVSMVSLIGLLAGGYTGLKKSMDTSIQTQLVKGVSSELAMTDFSMLTDLQSAFRSQFPRYYDADGQRTNETAARYIMTLSYTDSRVPGAETNASQALQVGVTITGKPNSGPAVTNVSCIWVVNNGR